MYLCQECCYGEGSPIAIRQHGAVFSQVSLTETDFDY